MFPQGFRPLLAERKTPDLSTLKYPVLASPKIDGIRCLIGSSAATPGQPRAFSRTLKPIPNQHIQRCLSVVPPYLDGELVTYTDGKMDDFTTTQSKVMSREGGPEFKLMVFDTFAHPDAPYHARDVQVMAWAREQPVVTERLKCVTIENVAHLAAYEQECVEAGYEGIMVRDPLGVYKYGRSTMKEGILLKVKRFEDDEGKIVGVIEEMANGNEDVKDAFGKAKRSTNAENMTGKGRLGAFKVAWRGVEFDLGTGFNAKQRGDYWDYREEMIGRKATFKYQGVGTLGRPRFPVFKALRSEVDL